MNNLKYLYLLVTIILLMHTTVLFSQNDSSNRKQIPGEILKSKREGNYWTFFPGAGYSPDMGLIIAGVVGFYDNGNRNDPNFAYTPYESSVMIPVSWSTKGMISLLADYDAPYFKNSLYRIRSRIWYMQNLTEPYFGTGLATMNQLTTPGGKVFDKYQDYYDDILLNEDGKTNAYYNYYHNKYILWNLNIERNLFHGISRVGSGIFLSKVWIKDYTGKKVPGKPNPDSKDREDAVQQQTLLQKDHHAGRIIGYNGGWNNTLRLSFACDTRDFESNPRNGMFHDISFALSDKLIGSDFDYTITTIATRFYVTPLPFWQDFICASRFLYSVKSGDVPFFTMNYIPITDKHVYGLGGEYTMRGYRLSRFVGKVTTVANLELRWIFTNFKIGGAFIEFMAVPFFDFGRVYDNMKDSTFKDMKYATGIGLRFSISQSFVVSFDYGFSEEESGAFYVTFGNIF